MGQEGIDTGSSYTSEFLERLRTELLQWETGPLRERLAPEEDESRFPRFDAGLKGETRSVFTSGSGEFVVKRVYTPLDINGTDPVQEIGLPALYPYTRGRDPVGYRAFRWPLNFYSGFGSSEGANRRYRELYAAGSREMTLALDLPTQIGLDSDHPLAEGEVGKVGLAVNTVADLERALEGIPLENLGTGTVGNCIGPWALAMFCVLCEKRNIDPSKVRVRIQNDPFKEYTGRGTYIFSPAVAVDLASDVVEYICKNIPSWEPQYPCTTTMRWGGSSASQEVGFGIANLVCYVDAAGQKGVKPEDFVPLTNLHMSSDSDLFEEVAKFRATRRLWAKISRERFGTDNPKVCALRLTVFTAANRLTAQEPLNNNIRTTMHVLAAMLGGVERISAPAHDEALALPTAESTRLASLTKHILHEECFIGNTVDPLGGSYYLESLTNQIEEKARYWFEDVQAKGGAKRAIETGHYLAEMANGTYRYQAEVENGDRRIVGVNKFVMDKEVPVKIFQGDIEGERRQVERLRQIREGRNSDHVSRSLLDLKKVAIAKVAGQQVNIVPAMLEAVRAYATVGEIFGTLREVFGEYRPPAIF